MLEKIPSQTDMVDLIDDALFEILEKLCLVINEKYDMEQTWNVGGKKFEPADTTQFEDYIKLLVLERKSNRK